MKKLLIILILVLILTDGKCQKQIYYHKGTSRDSLTLKSNFSFLYFGQVGLARSIIYSGKYRRDSIAYYLTQTTPTIINELDTNWAKEQFIIDRDTLFIFDSLTLISNRQNYYKLVKEYNSDTLIKEYNWAYIDTVVNHFYFYGYPIANGEWNEYYSNGKIKSVCIWTKGKRSNCFYYNLQGQLIKKE